MPIRWVVNGYYRSGTTILFYVIKKSHPELLHLYEPLTPNMIEAVKGHPIGSVVKLHGLEGIYDDYHKLVNLEELFKRHRRMDFILPLSLVEVKEFLDEIHSLSQDILIQPNNAHFILKDLKEEYECEIVHIIRDPADCWASHFPRIERLVTPDTPAYRGHPSDLGAFWLYPTFNKLYREYEDYLSKLGISSKSKDIDKFLACWYLCNKTAICYADYVFNIEDVARNPEIMKPKIDGKYYTMLDYGRLKIANSYLRYWINRRLRELGFKEVVYSV